MQRMTIKERSRLREIINTLLELPGSKIVWREDKPAIQRHYRLVIMWGRYDEKKYDATVYELLYFNGRRKEFISISAKHQLVNENGE